MSIYYDFHIHTALSPCASNDMTPNNIVNMSLIKGLDVIAVTDHNSFHNARSVMDVSKNTTLSVIPGMEVETEEEVHMVCLFTCIDALEEFGSLVINSLPPIKNRVDIFGEQLILDENDEVLGELDNLLITASSLSVSEVVARVEDFGGICYPAHIDRSSNSIISNLGFVPDDIKFPCLEISKKTSENEISEKYPYLSKYEFLRGSDAHYLEDISEKIYGLNVKSEKLVEFFKKTIKI